MADMIRIQLNAREELGSAASRRLRRAGLVPVVIYAHGKPALAKAVSADDAALVEYHASMIELAETDGSIHTAVVHELQRHPISGAILHIDFLAVRADEIIESEVAIAAAGEPVGARSGGELEQILFTVTVKSKPADVPEKILVDVSALEVGQVLHVRDIAVADGLAIATDGDLVAFQVREAAKAAEEAPADADAKK